MKYPCGMGSRIHLFGLLLVTVSVTLHAHAQKPLSSGSIRSLESRLEVDGLGKGAVPLDGPWQFHMGDTQSYASPDLDDATGHDGWEQIKAEKQWGEQGHTNFIGYAWYRRQITITPAPGASSDISLFIPAIDNVYGLYWNGVKVGGLGTMPPHLLSFSGVPAQIFGMGPARSGVLAVRVFKLPPGSTDDGISGGFAAMPLIGSPADIAAAKGLRDFEWLRRQQFRYGLTSLYVLVSLLSFLAWFRDRRQSLLLWIAIYAFTPLLVTLFRDIRLPWPAAALDCFTLVAAATREISQWFLLLYLLRLDENRRMFRLLRRVALFCVTTVVLDALLYFAYPALVTAGQYEFLDALLTLCYVPTQVVVLLLVASAFPARRHLDSAVGLSRRLHSSMPPCISSPMLARRVFASRTGLSPTSWVHLCS